MALGNTFGATSFCSYGGYWITFAVMSDLDITVLAADAEDSVCQKEIMMGLFMIVGNQPYVLSPSCPRCRLIVPGPCRLGSFSPRSCCSARSNRVWPCSSSSSFWT